MKQTTQQKTQVSKKGPHKYSNLKTIKDSYKEYSSEYPNSKLDISVYKKVCVTFFKEVLNHLIDGYEIRLPLLGVMKVIKKKRDFNKLQPDWKRTKELWSEDPEAKKNKKLVYHLNEHTKGYYYRFYWKKGKVKNISVYSFLPVRSAQKALSVAIVEHKKDYIG